MIFADLFIMLMTTSFIYLLVEVIIIYCIKLLHIYILLLWNLYRSILTTAEWWQKWKLMNMLLTSMHQVRYIAPLSLYVRRVRRSSQTKPHQISLCMVYLLMSILLCIFHQIVGFSGKIITYFKDCFNCWQCNHRVFDLVRNSCTEAHLS